MQRPEKVQKADGKLAVLLPGMGAVSTTLMAGVMLANKGLVKPIGSITQTGTIRLGKRTDNRVPRIKDFAPLAKLEDIVFGGWDLFPDNAYEAAAHAKVLESKDLEPIKDELSKIKPMDPFPVSPVKSAALQAGRNEFEPFQIVLRADDKDAADIDIEFSDLRSSHGDLISRTNLTVYFEQFLNITQPSVIGGETGLWPDPLIPRVDQYTHEKRNAFPFVLRRGRNQPLWIDVFVPELTRPGEYAGSARISRGGKAAFTVPISVTVWAFALPSTATLKSSFGLNGTAVLKRHLGRYTSDDDLYALTRLYAKAALQHRISIHGGSMTPPKYLEGGRSQLDWRAYDAEIGPFLDGTAKKAPQTPGMDVTGPVPGKPVTETVPMEQLIQSEKALPSQDQNGAPQIQFVPMLTPPGQSPQPIAPTTSPAAPAAPAAAPRSGSGGGTGASQ